MEWAGHRVYQMSSEQTDAMSESPYLQECRQFVRHLLFWSGGQPSGENHTFDTVII